jgi:hypothetical protein
MGFAGRGGVIQLGAITLRLGPNWPILILAVVLGGGRWLDDPHRNGDDRIY